MDISAFTDKIIVPDDGALQIALGNNYEVWKNIEAYVYGKYPTAVAEWKYTGAKYGWSFRLSDKKRVLIYLLPREGYFKAAFVFGEKATNVVLGSNVSQNIKYELEIAKPYAEGRGIRIDMKNKELLADIKMLVDIKLQN